MTALYKKWRKRILEGNLSRRSVAVLARYASGRRTSMTDDEIDALLQLVEAAEVEDQEDEIEHPTLDAKHAAQGAAWLNRVIAERWTKWKAYHGPGVPALGDYETAVLARLHGFRLIGFQTVEYSSHHSREVCEPIYRAITHDGYCFDYVPGPRYEPKTAEGWHAECRDGPVTVIGRGRIKVLEAA